MSRVFDSFYCGFIYLSNSVYKRFRFALSAKFCSAMAGMNLKFSLGMEFSLLSLLDVVLPVLSIANNNYIFKIIIAKINIKYS